MIKLQKALEGIRNGSLTSLNLEWNNIGDEGAKALADALGKDSRLTSLGLFGNSIGDEGAKALADALGKNSGLTSLYLGANNIGAEGAKALADALGKDSSLTGLNLWHNNIGDEGAKALADALEKNSSLTNLDLRRSNIGDEGAKALSDALGKNSSLTSLNLECNKIGDEGAKALAEALGKNSSLTSLDLRHNNIGAEGAKALADALGKNSSLTSLNLRGNNIGDEGAKALADALRENSSLTNLDLEYNRIGDEGAKALSNALEKNSGLTNLNLWGNNIGDEGAKALADALGKNSSLTSLNLQNNNISDEGAKAIIKALRQNTSLTYCKLYTARNKVSFSLLEEIDSLIERNKSLQQFITNATSGNLNQIQIDFPNKATAHKIDCLAQLIKATASNQDNLELRAKQLEIINYFLTQETPIEESVLNAAKESKDLEIQSLIDNFAKKQTKHQESSLVETILNTPTEPQSLPPQPSPTPISSISPPSSQTDFVANPDSARSDSLPLSQIRISESQINDGEEAAPINLSQISLQETEIQFFEPAIISSIDASEEKLDELKKQYQSLQEQLTTNDEQSKQFKAKTEKQLADLESSIFGIAGTIEEQRSKALSFAGEGVDILKLDEGKKRQLEAIFANHLLAGGEFASGADVARFYLSEEGDMESKQKTNNKIAQVKADSNLAKFYTDIKYYLNEIFTSAMIADVIGINRIAVLGNNAIDIATKGLSFAIDELPGGSAINFAASALASYYPDKKFSENYRKLINLCGDGGMDKQVLVETLALEIVSIFEEEDKKGDKAEIKKQHFENIFSKAIKQVQQLSPSNQNIGLKLSEIGQQATFYGTKMIAAIFNDKTITSNKKSVINRELINHLVANLRKELGIKPSKPTIQDFHQEYHESFQKKQQRTTEQTLEQRVAELECQVKQDQEIIAKQNNRITNLETTLGELTRLVKELTVAQSAKPNFRIAASVDRSKIIAPTESPRTRRQQGTRTATAIMPASSPRAIAIIAAEQEVVRDTAKLQ
jgi:Ran GTPase-activating protein (RanGAP) involved in mRNA processing and transport